MKSNKRWSPEIIEPPPMEPGEPQRYDYQYRRAMACVNLFMFFEPPLTAVEVTHRRTAMIMLSAIFSRCLRLSTVPQRLRLFTRRPTYAMLASTEAFAHMKPSAYSIN